MEYSIYILMMEIILKSVKLKISAHQQSSVNSQKTLLRANVCSENRMEAVLLLTNNMSKDKSASSDIGWLRHQESKVQSHQSGLCPLQRFREFFPDPSIQRLRGVDSESFIFNPSAKESGLLGTFHL